VTGSVTVDVAAAIRRSCTVTLLDPTGALTVSNAGDILSPLTGNEVVLSRGITYPDGTNELVPLGVFGISAYEVTDDAQGLVIALSGFDRSRRIQRAAFTDTYSILAGTNVAIAIQALVSSRVPGLTYNFAPTATLTPGLVYNTGEDPLAKAVELAASIGCALFFDPQGVCTLAPITDPTTQPPSWVYDEGSNATVIKLARRFVDTATFNDVIVTGGGTGVGIPVRAQAQDTNPSSPTFVGGPYGDVVTVVNSPLVTTVAQAQTMASGILNRSIGTAESLSFEAIVNPAHDVGDVITVNRARSKVAANYVVDSLTVPLTAQTAMTATARRRNT
jgi:hypothetical protein